MCHNDNAYSSKWLQELENKLKNSTTGDAEEGDVSHEL